MSDTAFFMIVNICFAYHFRHWFCIKDAAFWKAFSVKICLNIRCNWINLFLKTVYLFNANLHRVLLWILIAAAFNLSILRLYKYTRATLLINVAASEQSLCLCWRRARSSFFPWYIRIIVCILTHDSWYLRNRLLSLKARNQAIILPEACICFLLKYSWRILCTRTKHVARIFSACLSPSMNVTALRRRKCDWINRAQLLFLWNTRSGCDLQGYTRWWSYKATSGQSFGELTLQDSRKGNGSEVRASTKTKLFVRSRSRLWSCCSMRSPKGARSYFSIFTQKPKGRWCK